MGRCLKEGDSPWGGLGGETGRGNDDCTRDGPVLPAGRGLRGGGGLRGREAAQACGSYGGTAPVRLLQLSALPGRCPEAPRRAGLIGADGAARGGPPLPGLRLCPGMLRVRGGSAPPAAPAPRPRLKAAHCLRRQLGSAAVPGGGGKVRVGRAGGWGGLFIVPLGGPGDDGPVALGV